MLRGLEVTLRPMTADDIGMLYEFFTTHVIAQVWPGETEALLEKRLDDADDSVGMIVELEGRFIGFIQYSEESDPDYRSAAIDVALHPDWCNRGLGTDAVRTLARHLFDDLGHHRLTIDPAVSNARAIASYRKVGFRDVGVMRLYERGHDGTWHDGLLMDMLREDLR